MNLISENPLKYFVSLCLVCIIFFWGCTDNLINNHGETACNDLLFVGNSCAGQIFVINTETYEIIDTLEGFEDGVISFEICPDVKKIYISTENVYNSPQCNLYVYDLNLKTTRKLFPFKGRVELANNGELLLLGHTYDGNQINTKGIIAIIDPYSDIFTVKDTIDNLSSMNYRSVVFDPSEPLIYLPLVDNRIIQYNYSSWEIIRRYESIKATTSMSISVDGQKLFTQGAVYDLESDYMIATYYKSLYGSIALSHDQEKLYVTDPGSYTDFTFEPSGKIKIISTFSFNIIGEIDISSLAPPSNLYTDLIVISTDGTKAFVSNYGLSVYVLDLQMNEVINRIDLGEVNILIQSLQIVRKCY